VQSEEENVDVDASRDLQGAKYYPPDEERINIASHAFALILSVFAYVPLVVRAIQYGNARDVASFSIFGASLIILYSASMFYHSARKPALRSRLRVIDHASIYILIAGTYTPFTLIALNGPMRWTLFAVAWGMAVTGVVLKIFYTGRFRLLSTLMYVLMGWMMVFAIGPLASYLPSAGLAWLIAGGLAYTVGAILYSIKSIPFNHAIFHMFVIAGSASHFVAVYFYLLPDV